MRPFVGPRSCASPDPATNFVHFFSDTKKISDTTLNLDVRISFFFNYVEFWGKCLFKVYRKKSWYQVWPSLFSYFLTRLIVYSRYPYNCIPVGMWMNIHTVDCPVLQNNCPKLQYFEYSFRRWPLCYKFENKLGHTREDQKNKLEISSKVHIKGV